ncbi:hypothetical protein LZ30DRAFT_727101 [Colletotrichum cereale]|nr:hypothetical protein LZ30DRAFT_727101 [Colletotrichum cereale]
MFGGFAPPQLSEEEIKQMESEASFTVQQVLVSSILLYLCTYKPFAAPGRVRSAAGPTRPRERAANQSFCPAPFAIDAVSNFL